MPADLLSAIYGGVFVHHRLPYCRDRRHASFAMKRSADAPRIQANDSGWRSSCDMLQPRFRHLPMNMRRQQRRGAADPPRSSARSAAVRGGEWQGRRRYA
jgi:hypothetical protein